MRTLCDACEKAAAIVFCAADEAALCSACDDKVHMCNKLASRHVRVGLANPSDVPRCDICEKAPAFFYCEIDGSSLCLQCDVNAHVGGKRTHGRYLLLRQRVEFPGDSSTPVVDSTLQAIDNIDPQETKKGQYNNQHQSTASSSNNNNNVDKKNNKMMIMGENQQNQRISSDHHGHGRMENEMIDFNIKPIRVHEQPPNDQL